MTNPCQPEISIPLGGPPWTLGHAVSCCEASRIPAAIFSGEVDIVAVRDLLQTGEPVLHGVWSLSETVHDVDDFEVCDARYIE